MDGRINGARTEYGDQKVEKTLKRPDSDGNFMDVIDAYSDDEDTNKNTQQSPKKGLSSPSKAAMKSMLFE